ncbi:MAG TPA: HIT domain-containing protein [Thermodesulfobacteriota bacterium]|nr:HIT domain-containing protein [Thermodesulfobacteriota bacterium]
MKTIWAPWRIDYVTKEKEDVCIFCEKPKEKDDRKNLILYRGESGFIILNRYPYSNGHLMSVPYRHTSDLSELSDSERLELMNLTIMCVELLKVIKPDGFNVGMNLGRVAGAGIDDHLHFHVVPRWNGDTNFMPVIGDLRVMPEYLDQTYLRLAQELKIKGER